MQSRAVNELKSSRSRAIVHRLLTHDGLLLQACFLQLQQKLWIGVIQASSQGIGK